MAFSSDVPALFFLAFIFSISSIESIKHGGITLDLIHRDSPDSPLYQSSYTRYERLTNAFQRSFSRKSSLHRTYKVINSGSDLSSGSFESTLTPIGGEYLMKIGIGTPPVEILGIADTGSDLTWTQCKPCSSCFKQKSPLFDPDNTNTYRKVSCEAELCSAVGQWSCDGENKCNYEISYGDRSHSTGQIGTETFVLGNASFPKVVFGCGHDNSGTFNDTETGIVGLGGGDISIVKQLDKSIRGRFSYCLTFLDSNVSSKISFGADAVVTGPKVVSTPLVQKSPSTFYFLTLKGISVGNKKLEYISDASDYGQQADEGNIIIDSGTTLTFLPQELFYDLEAALVKVIKGNRVDDPQGVFELCYELPSTGEFDTPPIVVHFSGADLEVARGSTFIEVKLGVVCLTFVPSNDFSIFGNLHQMNVNIGYDLVKKEVSFVPTDCTKFE
ncbi:aspartic proteinase CDR1-like [Primulina huaijiensis]|uniref:aspartic proteinase CDR1-like n=1 Tax=Primulina huaijiensis TaxID=1492673 RepID=UPI003CC77899